MACSIIFKFEQINHVPVFNMTTLTASVPELAAASTVLLALNGTDVDLLQNLTYAAFARRERRLPYCATHSLTSLFYCFTADTLTVLLLATVDFQFVFQLNLRATHSRPFLVVAFATSHDLFVEAIPAVVFVVRAQVWPVSQRPLRRPWFV